MATGVRARRPRPAGACAGRLGYCRGEAGHGPAPAGGDWRKPCAAGFVSPDLGGCAAAQRAVGGGAERVAAVSEWAAGVGEAGAAGGNGEWGAGVADLISANLS